MCFSNLFQRLFLYLPVFWVDHGLPCLIGQHCPVLTQRHRLLRVPHRLYCSCHVSSIRTFQKTYYHSPAQNDCCGLMYPMSLHVMWLICHWLHWRSAAECITKMLFSVGRAYYITFWTCCRNTLYLWLRQQGLKMMTTLLMNMPAICAGSTNIDPKSAKERKA